MKPEGPLPRSKEPTRSPQQSLSSILPRGIVHPSQTPRLECHLLLNKKRLQNFGRNITWEETTSEVDHGSRDGLDWIQVPQYRVQRRVLVSKC
jgi:hypothetical protein